MSEKKRIQLQTTNIRGKNYVEVNTRIQFFREDERYKDWSLESEVVELNGDHCIFRAVIRDEAGRVRATGFAHEKANSSHINKTSYVENCETSAWGRALGNLGIGIKESIASAEEVSNAIHQQSEIQEVFKITDAYDPAKKGHKEWMLAVFKKLSVTDTNAMKVYSARFLKEQTPLKDIEEILAKSLNQTRA